MQQGFGKFMNCASLYGGGINVLSSNTEVEQKQQIIRELNQITDTQKGRHRPKCYRRSLLELFQISSDC
jgi:hypothetical protein